MSQIPKEVPSVSFLPTPPGAAEATMERWQLQYHASASRGQQSSTRGQVWRPCMAQQRPLGGGAHRNQGKRLQHSPAGGNLCHSFIHSVSQAHSKHAVSE